MALMFKSVGMVLVILLILAAGLYVMAGWSEKPLDAAARANAPGQFFQTSAGQLHYRWHGPEDGPIIVMAHGFSTPNFIFEQNAEALAIAGFRVLTFDHFGRGWSDRPHGKYTPDFYDTELIELTEGLGIPQPFGLVGLSMGGPIAAEFTARHPERVSALFLFVPAGLTISGTAGDTNDRILRTPVLGDWVWRMFGKRILLGDRQYDESELTPSNRLAGDVAEQMDYEGYLSALLSSYRHLPMRDRDALYERVNETGVPLMAVFGENDMTVLIESADRLAVAAPNAQIVRLVGGEHGLNYQRHAETNPMLVDFFSTGRPSVE